MLCPQLSPNYLLTKGLTLEITEGNFRFAANVVTAADRGETVLGFKLWFGSELYGEYVLNVEYK